MSAADILAAHGILRAPEVVELATAARLDLACAAVLLIKESGGGNNVWGHDNVSTAGCYDKGGAVTRDNYTAYRYAVAAGRAGRQGCGPTQLTYGPYQDRADRAGGCWDWRTNVATGFGILARLIDQYGERDGFRRYNGAGAAAEHYADDAMTKLERWRNLLSATSTGGSTSPSRHATISRGDTGPDVELVQRWLGVVGSGDPGYGTFGPLTDAAVRRYQAQHGLAVDGIVGPRTWAEMGL